LWNIIGIDASDTAALSQNSIIEVLLRRGSVRSSEERIFAAADYWRRSNLRLFLFDPPVAGYSMERVVLLHADPYPSSSLPRPAQPQSLLPPALIDGAVTVLDKLEDVSFRL
jgi:hypothetical protein